MAAAAIAKLDGREALASKTSLARPQIATDVVHFVVPELTYPPSRCLQERRAKGTIKSFSQEKGFGYVECAELKEVFGGDVFLHARQNPLGLAEGTEVTFALLLGKDSKPQAFDVLEAVNGNGGGKGGAQKRTFSQGPGAIAAMGLGVQEELGQYLGVLKSFSEKTGYGFVSSPDLAAKGYSNECMLHYQQARGHAVGSQVFFTAYINNKGQLQAKNLAAIKPPPS